MEASSFPRNLEPVGPDIRLINWKIISYEESLSEKRYLGWRFRDPLVEHIDPPSVRYRLQAAGHASPDCLPGIEVERTGPTLSILSPYASPIDWNRLNGDTARDCVRTVVRVLAAFDAHALVAASLAAVWLWRSGDGSVTVAPPAYALPPVAGGSARGEASELPSTRGPRAHEANRRVFERLVTGLAERIDKGTEREPMERLVRWATGGWGGWDEALRVLDGAGVSTHRGGPDRRDAAGGRRGPGSRDDAETAPDKTAPDAPNAIAAIADEACAATKHASLVAVHGPPGSGRSYVIERIAQILSGDGCRVSDATVDEIPARSTPSGARCDVVLIDNVEGRRDVWHRLLEYCTDETHDGCVVWSADHGVESDGLPPYLRRLAARAARGVVQLRLPAQADEETRAAHASHDSVVDDPDGASGGLARRILDICAVAKRELPLTVIAPAFGDEAENAPAVLQRMAARGLLRIAYSQRPVVEAYFGIASTRLRQHVYDAIADKRRVTLHRTIARFGNDTGALPRMAVAEHFARARDNEEATRVAAAFVASSTRTERLPYHDVLLGDILRGPGMPVLDYASGAALRVRVASDLVLQGQNDAAEEILLPLREIDADLDEYHATAPLISEAMRLLADVWAARSQYRLALDLLVETRDDLSAHLSLAEQAQLMNELGWLHYRLGEYDQAADACRLSLNSLSPNEHALVVGQALNLMGVICFNTSRYDEAISYYEKAAILRKKRGDRNALAGSYNNLALAYQARGEYDKALESYERSLEIKKAENNEAGIAAGYLNQALLHLDVHNFDEAERKCRASLELAVQLGIAQLMAENYSTLGDIACRREFFDEAETFYRKSLALASSLETANEELGARRRLARLYLDVGRTSDADELIAEAARLAQRIGSRYESAQVEELRGDSCAASDDTEAAIEHFENAARMYADASKYRNGATALARAGLAHESAGRTAPAGHCLDRANDMIKSDIGREVPDEIVTLRQQLRKTRPAPAPDATALPPEVLLRTFYDLGALADQAAGRNEQIARITEIFTNASRASTCYLVFESDGDTYLRVDGTNEAVPVIDPQQRRFFGAVMETGVAAADPGHNDDPSGIAPPEGEAYVCVPLGPPGSTPGCAVLYVPSDALPLPNEVESFYLSIGRHAANALRLSIRDDRRTEEEATGDSPYGSFQAPAAGEYRARNLIGKDASMRKVFQTLEKVKNMDTGILVIGESGTGKTELARTIHYNSVRSRHHFQQIHCAEIPMNLLESELFGHERGAFTGALRTKLGRCEVADGGTVFLDDVNVMPLDTQAKLLHYLESKSFTRLGGTRKIRTDVRIIAASNEDLEELVQKDRFREDLFYRLRVLQIELPPLRERPEDLAAISREYLKRRCGEQKKPLKTLSTETMKLFRAYSWPGNVRELQNVLEQIVLLCDSLIVEPPALPEDFLRRASDSPPTADRSVEDLIEQIVRTGDYSAQNPLMPRIEAILAQRMAQHIENKSRAARLLGITKPTLYTRIRNYDRTH